MRHNAVMVKDLASYKLEQAQAYWHRKGITLATKDQCCRLWKTMEATNQPYGAQMAHRAYFYWDLAN